MVLKQRPYLQLAAPAPVEEEPAAVDLRSNRLVLATIEQRALLPLSALALAERRITAAELRRLHALIDAYPELASARETLTFRLEFWRRIANAARNAIVQQQVRWWERLACELEARGAHESQAELLAFSSRPVSRAMYRQLLDALERRQGAVQVWLSLVDELCAAQDAAACEAGPEPDEAGER